MSTESHFSFSCPLSARQSKGEAFLQYQSCFNHVSNRGIEWPMSLVNSMYRPVIVIWITSWYDIGILPVLVLHLHYVLKYTSISPSHCISWTSLLLCYTEKCSYTLDKYFLVQLIVEVGLIWLWDVNCLIPILNERSSRFLFTLLNSLQCVFSTTSSCLLVV